MLPTSRVFQDCQVLTNELQFKLDRLVRSTALKQWQLQVAKAKLSEMVREASIDGPQEITLHGEPVAVMVSKKLYEKMRARKPSFMQFMRSSPLVGCEVEFERNPSHNRDVDL